MDKSLYHAKPNNYDDLIENEEFLNILSIVKRTRKKGIERYNDIIAFLQTTIEAIQNELELRDP